MMRPSNPAKRRCMASLRLSWSKDRFLALFLVLMTLYVNVHQLIVGASATSRRR